MRLAARLLTRQVYYVAMIDLRALLIDCRVALRVLPGRTGQALLQRVEVALTEVAKSNGGSSSSSSQTAQQVALAWQTAARGLKHSHEELFDELSARVMELLGTRTLYEPTKELLMLQAQSEESARDRERMERRLEEAQERQKQAQGQLDTLQKALAAAMPEGHGRDAQQQAEHRLEALIARASSPGAVARALEGPAPTREKLEQIADGDGSFTREQRDWVIGEALGLTGWAHTPVELIEKGDVWLAALVLDQGSPE
jgi:hypothetical protein